MSTRQPSTGKPADADAARFARAFYFTAGFVVLLWIVKFSELLFGLDLSGLGVYPRRFEGLIGVLFAPIVHGSIAHLFANTPPLIVLGAALLYGYPRSARIVLPVLYLGTGIAVWLFARSAWHIGASGLTFGLMFYVFTIGALRWDRRAIALSLVVFFLYGGMIWGLLPTAPDVSFESHIAGATLGVLLAVLMRHVDPPPPRKTYSWENETDDEDDVDWPFDSDRLH